MTPYKNLTGKSGVSAYQQESDRISVQFQDGKTYVYSYASAGKGNVEIMKMLAEAGKGLSTFISQVVKDKYERKD